MDWFRALTDRDGSPLRTDALHTDRDRRDTAEDAAALAFAKLPAERRAELLGAAQPA